MIRKQHRLFKRRRTKPTPENIHTHKSLRNKLKKKIKAAKKQDIQQKMKNTHNDPKKQAKILKRLIPKSQQAISSPAMIAHKEQTHKDPQEIANTLNDHFITIGQRANDTTPATRRQRSAVATVHP